MPSNGAMRGVGFRQAPVRVLALSVLYWNSTVQYGPFLIHHGVVAYSSPQRLQVSRILRETHAFGGKFMASRRETSFLTHFGKIYENLFNTHIAISQEPEDPQKSMTYQNACTECREFNSVTSFNPN